MSHIRYAPGPLFQRQFDQAAPIVNATVNIGDITIDTGGYDSGTLAAEWVEETAAGTTTIADSLGALLVEVMNVGGTVEGTDFANIVVNGDTVAPGGTWQVQTLFDMTTQPPTQLFTPEVSVVNADNSAFRYRVTKIA